MYNVLLLDIEHRRKMFLHKGKSFAAFKVFKEAKTETV